jgi:hypothetical protein
MRRQNLEHGSEKQLSHHKTLKIASFSRILAQIQAKLGSPHAHFLTAIGGYHSSMWTNERFVGIERVATIGGCLLSQPAHAL